MTLTDALDRPIELTQPSAASLTEASGNPCGDHQAAHLPASRHGSRARARAPPRHRRRPRPFQPSLAATSSRSRRHRRRSSAGSCDAPGSPHGLAGTIGTPTRLPPPLASRATPQAQAERTRVRASGHRRRPPSGPTTRIKSQTAGASRAKSRGVRYTQRRGWIGEADRCAA
jgi:hypothetical protein